MSVQSLSPNDVKQMVESRQALLIDVREPSEYREENIPNAVNIPLASINDQSIAALGVGKKLVFQCQGGKRSQEACRRIHALEGSVASLDGGIEGWKRAGFSTIGAKPAAALPLMRQVQMTIGICILIGIFLAIFLSPVFLIIPAFMGLGLIMAGLTGWCGLARLMALLPWNRQY